MHLPQTDHLEAVMRIVRYLKGTCGRGILFKRNGNLDLLAYTNGRLGKR